MAKAYNYTIAENHQAKIPIPYIGIEIEGWSTLFAGILGITTVTFVIGIPLSFLLGSLGFFLGFGMGVVIVSFAITYSNEVNNETGRTKLKEFYYIHVKKYRFVYDKDGNKYYLNPKKKGVVYINACRYNTRI